MIETIFNYIRNNRRQIIRAFVAAIIALIVAAFFWYGVEWYHSARYGVKVKALESKVATAEEEAKEAERQAESLKDALEAQYEQLRAIQERAGRAEAAWRKSRQAVEPLKQEYEETRGNPADIPIDTTCADACARLAALGFPCQ